MSTNTNNNLWRTMVFVLSLLVCSVANAWYEGNNHYHGGGRWGGGHYHGGYNRGGYYNGGAWFGPNVVISVPPSGYYSPPPQCRTVEVCAPDNECWLQRMCD